MTSIANDFGQAIENAQSLADSLVELAQRVSKQVVQSPCVDAETTKRAVGYSPRNAEIIYRARRIRDRHFSSGLFGEAAWDILLDIYAKQTRGKRVSVSSACIGACVPPTTALRWIALLEDEGLLERSPDPLDGRRFFLSLTSSATEKMVRYFEAVLEESPG